MFFRTLRFSLLLFAALLFAGCAQATPTPRVVCTTCTPAPTSPVQVLVVTATTSASATPLPAEPATTVTATPAPLPTLLPTTTPLPPTVRPTAAPVRRPTAAPPAATAAPSFEPGVYVTAMRLDPPQPVRGSGVTFYATFVNSTGAPQSLKWLVYIYLPDQKNTFGETAPVSITVPPGTFEFATGDEWHLTGGGACESFYAQAVLQNPDRTRSLFLSTDGSMVSLSFDVCPP